MTSRAADMTLDDAISLARAAHADTSDKAGRPYIDHVLRVMERLRADGQRFGGLVGDPEWADRPEEQAVCMAGVLHDVLEDTAVTAEDLLARGCPPDVVEAVVALSRIPGESYQAFLRRLSANQVARTVKRADIDDNADESRLALLPPGDAARLREKYAAARRLLDDLSLHARVLEAVTAHPGGRYRYFLNDNTSIGLMRQWRWDDDGHEKGELSWPEHLHPETTGGRWKAGNAYLLDAITGMGEDPYSCGEGCQPLTEKGAARLARKMGVDLDADRMAP